MYRTCYKRLSIQLLVAALAKTTLRKDIASRIETDPSYVRNERKIDSHYTFTSRHTLTEKRIAISVQSQTTQTYGENAHFLDVRPAFI